MSHLRKNIKSEQLKSLSVMKIMNQDQEITKISYIFNNY